MLPHRALAPPPCPRSPPPEFGKARDNIRCTHWVGDNNLLLVSYLDQPGME
jgi:hypothetical protein